MAMTNHRGSRILALSGRTARELIRDPLSWVFALAFPLLMLGMFTIIDNSIPPETGMTRFAPGNIGPGILVFAQCFLTLFVSLLVSGDRDNAFLTRLLVTPAAPMEFHLGYVLPSAVLGLAQGILTMLAIWLLSLIRGQALPLTGCLGAVLCALPTLFFCIGLGIFLGSLLSSKAAPGISSVILSAASFLGGCWMDPALLGEGFETVCTLLPWYPAARMGRFLLGMEDWHRQDPAVVCFWSALFFLLSCHVMKKRIW